MIEKLNYVRLVRCLEIVKQEVQRKKRMPDS